MNRFRAHFLRCLAAILGLASARAALLTLDNGTIKVGAETTMGGSITYLSLSGSTTNLINSYDLGRQVQQSYYSGPTDFHPVGTTQHPSWSPWPWNPIQTGDVYNNKATVLASSNTGGVIYLKTRPMQWALQNVPGDCNFEWWIRLEGAAVRVHCRLTNQRTDLTQYPGRHQELPAVYGVGTLNRVFSYTGTAPFTGGALTQLPSTGPPWTYWRPTENWSAMVNSSDFGIGVHHPHSVFAAGGYASNFLPGTGGPTNYNTGYIAPLQLEVLDANLVFEYDFDLIVGSLTDIRAWVYAHASDHSPVYRFATDRGHWSTNLGDAGPPAGYLRQKLGDDPQLQGPFCAFQAADVPTIYFSARYNMTTPPGSPLAQLFWETNNAGGFTGAQSRTVAVTPTAGWRIYSFALSSSAAWTGMISQLRFDPIQSGATTDTVDLGGISWKNDAPVATGLADLSTAHGAAVPTVNFTVSDDLMPEEALTVAGTSSNQALLPNAAIIPGGSGANRTLTLTPATGKLGSTTVTVTVGDTARTAPFSFLLTVTGTPVETWRFSNFGNAANTGTAADLADPNNDGIFNLLEFFLHRNPNGANSPTTLPALSRLGGTLDYRYARSIAALGEVTHTVEWSDTLAAGNWSNVGVSEEILSDDGTVQRVKATIPAGPGRQRFVRVKVTK